MTEYFHLMFFFLNALNHIYVLIYYFLTVLNPSYLFIRLLCCNSDVENFCHQLVEMEEEAVKKISGYSGLK